MTFPDCACPACHFQVFRADGRVCDLCFIVGCEPSLDCVQCVQDGELTFHDYATSSKPGEIREDEADAHERQEVRDRKEAEALCQGGFTKW